MKIDPRTLMLLYDGELDAREAARVRRQIAFDPEAQRILAGYAELGGALRIWSEHRAPARSARALRRAHPVARRAFGLAWVGAAAAALVMALCATHSGDSRPVASVLGAARMLPSHAAPTTASVGSAPSDEGTESTGAAIEVVDFGAGGGTIFMVSKGAQATPVVWLSDNDDDDSADQQTKSL
jgi:hypothetical protein